MTDIRTDTTHSLDAARIPYRILAHDGPVFTCEDAARARGVRPAQVTKTMVGRDPTGKLYVMLLPGDQKLKIKRVRQAAGGKRIELVPPDEIASQLGLVVGAISPIDLIGKADIYMDRRLLDEKQVTVSAGVPEAGIELASQQLAELLAAVIGDFVSTSASA
jgi:Cys-tRNA(Pro) deacylase